MREHYSHIRIDAKRQALDALDAARRTTAPNGNGDGEGADAMKKGQTRAELTPSSRYPTSSRHSHITVCG